MFIIFVMQSLMQSRPSSSIFSMNCSHGRMDTCLFIDYIIICRSIGRNFALNCPGLRVAGRGEDHQSLIWPIIGSWCVGGAPPPWPLLCTTAPCILPCPTRCCLDASPIDSIVSQLLMKKVYLVLSRGKEATSFFQQSSKFIAGSKLISKWWTSQRAVSEMQWWKNVQ